MIFAKWFVLSVAPVAASLLCASARASDYEVGASLACDTQAQVERFVALFSGDTQTAIRIVNAEEQNASACVIRNVAYMRGKKVGTARHGDSAFEIVRILIVGIETSSGILPVHPTVHFSLFGVKEYAV
jgi:hypothetical protein